MAFPLNKEKHSAVDDWLHGFLARNPSISLRKPETISINRITVFNKEEVTIFFNNLEKI